MGPRLFSRGNLNVRSRDKRCLFMLQWGRGFSAAEIGAGGSGQIVGLLSLQWGRGFSAAEISALVG